MRVKAYIIFLMTITSLFIIPVHATGVTISTQNGQFQTRMILSLHQNITALPTTTLSLDASQDSSLRSAFANALQQADPSAQLSGLTLQITSTNDWLNVTATMGVSGVSTLNGDVASFNSTWKSFDVATDLSAQNLSYNTVGRVYFRPAVEFYVNASNYELKPNATITAVTFFANETSVPGYRLADQVGNFTLFDFSPLDVPLEQWNRTYNIQNDTTIWRYTPAEALAVSVSGTRGLNNTFQIFANYGYDAEIVLPGLGQGSGNTLLVDVGSGHREEVMVGAVIFFIALAVGVQMLFRSKKRKVILGRR
ncbi:MAG TPA: hypothetical protein VJZ03_00895 [Candidatus Bathyarchaeia archaeon]|nr:hypothetical protein [Candidatus Bathyarchaeia archaeon]